ncbi:uncharacterized protein A4U43_C07F14580 [Asparagus officinalis]|uniref:Uncharacterized protein n=1 Tax=Asparagus officinalis TaxID=4686 RepID=A0A5P1EBX4_ASPOF|nr:uncharacterized protein A4U43_C07F14580 [Asparagus officinalis]
MQNLDNYGSGRRGNTRALESQFEGFLYAAILSKLLPPPENPFLSAIQNDRYYCLLLPLTLPVLVVAVYLHWLSMKLFRHLHITEL